MIRLYRTVSDAEWSDYLEYKAVRVGRNTLEAKQFFKTETGVREFLKGITTRNFLLLYKVLLQISLDPECFEKLIYGEQELDRFEAITVQQEHLPAFINCIKFFEWL